MEPVGGAALPRGALVLVDSAPIIYLLESHPKLAARFRALFEQHAAGEIAFAVTTIAMAEVLAGPLGKEQEVLAKRYRGIMESWQVVDLTADIAESAARIRANLKLKLPDAVQVASALAIHADALVTHDRDFSGVTALRVLV
jgi:predicted nucleic acid-binding protein